MIRILPFIVVALLAGAVGGGVVAAVDGGSGTKTVVEETPLASSTKTALARGLSARDIYKRYSPGVVYVTAEVVQQSESPFGFGEPEQGTATGTGFVIDEQGDILTNAHVVNGARSVNVRLGGTRYTARIVGKDESTDVALLKIDPGGKDLTVLPLGSSKDLEVGDPTVAIGNPFGLDRTLTTGVVSALQRRIEAPNGFAINDVIQTDAAINPGNSGGPLIDATGRTVGINSQIETGGSSGGNVGIGFAVPIETAKRILPELKKKGSVERAYLGVTTATIDDRLASLHVPLDKGALVQSVAPGSPAAKAGIRAGKTKAEVDGDQVMLGGDIIVAVDDKPIDSGEELQAVIGDHKAGDQVTVRVHRGGDDRTVTVKLAKRTQTTG